QRMRCGGSCRTRLGYLCLGQPWYRSRRVNEGSFRIRVRRNGRSDMTGAFDFSHFPDETKTLSRERADQPLTFTAVPYRCPRRVDPCSKRRIRNGAALPHMGDQLPLADHPISVPHEVCQEIENSRLNRNDPAPALQFAALGMEHIVLKNISHEGRKD